MAKSRVATDTIKGYYYQFDHAILKLLDCKNDNDNIIIEGLEDVDLTTTDETTAIQCKYYAKTEYNHSVIAQPLRYMMDHYLNRTDSQIKYKIYGFYKNGQDKLKLPITTDSFRSNFIGLKAFEDLTITDDQISHFLTLLEIDNNAQDFEEQEKSILSKLKEMFSCNDFEAEHYYYNNALRVIHNKSIQSNETARSLSKREFIEAINKKEILFNQWYLCKRGIDKYCSMVRKEYFSSTNISPFERFFLFEVDDDTPIVNVKNLVLEIVKKYHKATNRTTDPYSPYIFFHNLHEQKILELKKALYSDDVKFIDGYDFKGSEFSVKSICQSTDVHNQIKFKIIDDSDNIKDVLMNITKTREIFQFFKNQPFWESEDNSTNKHILIPVETFEQISKII